MIGLLRKARVKSFQRSDINESARPSLSGFNLTGADQARQSTLADGEERSSVTWGEGDRFKSGHDGTMILGAHRIRG
jgi:hypothetical protein